MRYPFKELPGASGRHPRPVVPIVIGADTLSPYYCLVDSGSLGNRFGSWIAELHGIDLTGAPEDVVAVGGFRTVSKTVPVQLSAAGLMWEAPVSFCDPWPLDFQLLGQEGFFRWFAVTIRAAQFTIDLEPEDR